MRTGPRQEALGLSMSLGASQSWLAQKHPAHVSAVGGWSARVGYAGVAGLSPVPGAPAVADQLTWLWSTWLGLDSQGGHRVQEREGVQSLGVQVQIRTVMLCLFSWPEQVTRPGFGGGKKTPHLNGRRCKVTLPRAGIQGKGTGNNCRLFCKQPIIFSL